MQNITLSKEAHAQGYASNDDVAVGIMTCFHFLTMMVFLTPFFMS